MKNWIIGLFIVGVFFYLLYRVVRVWAITDNTDKLILAYGGVTKLSVIAGFLKIFSVLSFCADGILLFILLINKLF